MSAGATSGRGQTVAFLVVCAVVPLALAVDVALAASRYSRPDLFLAALILGLIGVQLAGAAVVACLYWRRTARKRGDKTPKKSSIEVAIR